jgi:EasF-like predicted methyltransferase
MIFTRLWGDISRYGLIPYSSNLRKTNIILQALDELGYEIDYFALDVSLPELRRTLRQLPAASFRYVRCFGLLGTYDDGRRWLQQPAIRERRKTIMSLGSTLGSFSRQGCSEFLSSFCLPGSPGEQTQPSFLLGLDGCKDGRKVFDAYNDPQGLNQKFIKHGLERANELLGYNAFDLKRWGVVGYWDEHNGRHEQLYTTLTTVELNGITLSANQTLRATWSHKYDEEDISTLCRNARLQVVNSWSSAEKYSVCYLDPIIES